MLQPGEIYRAGNVIVVVGSRAGFGSRSVTRAVAHVPANLHLDNAMMNALYHRWLQGNGLPLSMDLTCRILLEMALTDGGLRSMNG